MEEKKDTQLIHLDTLVLVYQAATADMYVQRIQLHTRESSVTTRIQTLTYNAAANILFRTHDTLTVLCAPLCACIERTSWFGMVAYSNPHDVLFQSLELVHEDTSVIFT